MSRKMTISKYKRSGIFSRAIGSFSFFSIGIVSVVWIAIQLYRPDFYVASHAVRYFLLAVLATIATLYIAPTVATHVIVLLKMALRNDEGISLDGERLSYGQIRRFVIELSSIRGILLEPRNPAIGRPERLKIELNDGDKHYIRCDILDRSGTELLREIETLRAQTLSPT
jgi:hypothetical protein